MSKRIVILICLIFIKFLLQYSLINPEYDLHRDEYLHLDQANHLAWGYTSVPPMTSWLSYIIKLLGNTPFWVQFFPALFGACTIIVVWKTIESLNGNLFALVLGGVSILLSSILRLNVLYQPNSFDVLSWVCFYFFLIKFIQTNQAKWLFITAIIFALGFMNKYNIVFLLIGLIPAILMTEHRKILIQKQFYLSALLALILISPNLWWQYTHDFPVFKHLKELSDTQLVNVQRWGFLKSQAIYFMGSLPIILAALYALWAYKPFKKYHIFFWIMLFTLGLFVYLKAKDYYAMGLYPIYMALGSVYLGDILVDNKRYLRFVIFCFSIVVFIPMYLYAFPNRSPEYIIQHSAAYRNLGLLRWEDGKNHSLPQDFSDMLGWKELALKVDFLYVQLSNPKYTLILCDNYGQAGAINYYTRHKNIHAVSFNADYLYWFDLDTPIKDVIRIKNATEKDDELNESAPFFETAYLADSITNVFSREYNTGIFVFRNAKIDVNQRIKNEIQEVKNRHQ